MNSSQLNHYVLDYRGEVMSSSITVGIFSNIRNNSFITSSVMLSGISNNLKLNSISNGAGFPRLAK